MPVGEAAGGRSPLGSSARRARPTCSEIAILSAVGPPNAAGPSPSRGGGCSSAGSTRSSCSSSRNTTSPSTSRVDGTPAPAAGGARPTCSEAGAREMAACGGVALRRRQPPSPTRAGPGLAEEQQLEAEQTDLLVGERPQACVAPRGPSLARRLSRLDGRCTGVPGRHNGNPDIPNCRIAILQLVWLLVGVVSRNSFSGVG